MSEILQGHRVTKQEELEELLDAFSTVVSALCQNASQAAILGNKLGEIVEAAEAVGVEKFLEKGNR